MSTSTWSFTLITEANGVETTQPGTVDAPGDATKAGILTALLDQLRQTTYRGVNFQVVSFDARRIG